MPDSASTGSAWATGTKTYDNAVSVNLTGQPQKTLLELAKEKGLKTGDVTTSEVQDATPAVQVSHISARSCYGPDETTATCPSEALENGGLGSITEQLLGTRPDVTLAGGAATFAQTAKAGPYAGKTLSQQAVERGYQMVSDEAGLAAVSSANQSAPVLGLFAPGNMPVRWVGPAATVGGSALPPVQCTDNPARPATQPTLAEMTTKAIQLLENPNGFFLQVEGASIDKQDHAADACGQIGETVDLDEAVQVALAYARANGNTSVFVTADHGHTSQIVEVGSSSPGKTVRPDHRGRRADGGQLRHVDRLLAAAHRHPGADRGLRPAGREHRRPHRPDRPVLHDPAGPVPRRPGARRQRNAARVQISPDKPKAGAKVSVVASNFAADNSVTFTVTRSQGPDQGLHPTSSQAATRSWSSRSRRQARGP